jgi:hypothetical protein
VTVQCVACLNFSLRGSELARHGFGNCAKKSRCEYPSAVYPRYCQQFVQADADQEAARRSWLDERGTKNADRTD